MTSLFFSSRDKTNKRPVSFFGLNPPKQSKTRPPTPKFIPNPSPFFSGVKKSKNTSSPVNFSPYPVRTKQETRLIDKNPWGDNDRDKIPNIFDCRPLDGYLQGAIHPVKNRRQQKYEDKKPNQTHGASKGKNRMNRNTLKQKKKSNATIEAERVARLKERASDLRHREAIGLGYTRQEKQILGGIDNKAGLPMINVGRHKIEMTKEDKKEFKRRKKAEKHFHKSKPINKYGPEGPLAHLNPKNAENQEIADRMNQVVKDNLGNLFYPTGGLKYGASKKPGKINDPNRKTKRRSYVNKEDLIQPGTSVFAGRRFVGDEGQHYIVTKEGKIKITDPNGKIIEGEFIEKSTGFDLDKIKREGLLEKINKERQTPEYLDKVNARRKKEGKSLLKNIFPVTDNMLRKIGVGADGGKVSIKDINNSLLQKSTKLPGEKLIPIKYSKAKIQKQIEIDGKVMSEDEAEQLGLKEIPPEKAARQKAEAEAEEKEYQRRKAEASEGLLGDKRGIAYPSKKQRKALLSSRHLSTNQFKRNRELILMDDIKGMVPGLEFGEEYEKGKIPKDDIDDTYNQEYFSNFEADYGVKNDYDPTKEAQSFLDEVDISEYDDEK